MPEDDPTLKEEPPEPTLSLRPDQGEVHYPGPVRAWGPFRLLERVGRGSFGEVYRAYDTLLDRQVALKLLLPEQLAARDQNTVLREARAMAKVRHPNIVSVYGVAEHDGRPGFWSDFVNGQTLSAFVAQHGAFSAREVAAIGLDLAQALSAVHRAGLLHLDIKASNVMRESGGRILLMDFGLTLEHGSASGVRGTVPYIAPEILRGEAASQVSDIYSLGVLLYYLASGRYPFRETSVLALKAAHEQVKWPRLPDDRPDLPEPLARVIETAMAADPGKRYSTAGELISALSHATGAAVIHSTRVKTRWRGAWALAALLIASGAAFYGSSLWRPGPKGASPAMEQAEDLLEHYYKPGNVDNAIRLFQQATQEDPKRASAFAGLCRAHWRKYQDTHSTDSIEPARQACNRAIELDRGIVSPHVTLARIYTEQGKTDSATEELNAAVKINGKNADAYSAFADLYRKEGRAAEVEPAIQKAIDFAPGAWPYLNQLGLFYLEAGRYTAAAQQFEQAAKLSPANGRAWNNLGVSYQRQGQLEQAEAAYRKSLAVEPASNALSNLGNILQFEGKNQEAADVYRQALRINPSRYLTWGNLASALNRMPGGKAEARETYRKAIAMAQEAYTKTPDNAALVSYLGSYYAALDDATASIPLLRKAAALEEDDPDILYRVGEAYELLGKRDDALKWITRALVKGLPKQTIERNPELENLRTDPKFSLQRGTP